MNPRKKCATESDFWIVEKYNITTFQELKFATDAFCEFSENFQDRF